MTYAAKEAQVSLLTSVDQLLEDASRSYLYPHAWPPGQAARRRMDRDGTPPLGARAVIGNELRLPAVWCELGACIARFSHPDALGLRDVRARAEAAGWRQDALGRLACPRCQQTDPAFRATFPLAPRG